MQPLANSTISPTEQPSILQPNINSLSTPKSPNSLIIKAILLPLAVAKRFCIKLVLPAPKNPVTTVAGILFNF